jgi:hypothetical protein
MASDPSSPEPIPKSRHPSLSSVLDMPPQREDMQEVQVQGPPSRTHWAHDSQAFYCHSCRFPFSLVRRRKHHCRCCGEVFCAECSSKDGRLDHRAKFNTKGLLVRLCDACFSNYEAYCAQKRASSIHHLQINHQNPLLSPPLLQESPVSLPADQKENRLPTPAVSISSSSESRSKRNESQEPPTPMLSVPSDWEWSTF